MNPARTLLGVALSLAVCGNAIAQPAPQTGRIPTVTRLVKVFSDLEAELQEQARSADPAALESSLDPSFEMREGGAPGTPVPRDDWIRRTRATAAQHRSIDQMAVHDLGSYALVSFREVETATTAGSRHQRFVVDCWKRDGDSWKLAIRYASDVSATSRKRVSTGTLDKRY